MTDNSSSKAASEESLPFEIEQNWPEGLENWSVRSDDSGNLELLKHNLPLFTVFFNGNWNVSDKRLLAECMMGRGVIVQAQSCFIVSNSSIPGIKLMLANGASKRCIVRSLQRYEKISREGLLFEDVLKVFYKHASIDEQEERIPSNFESYLEMIEMTGEEFARNYIAEEHLSTQVRMSKANDQLQYVRDGLYRRLDFSKISPSAFNLLAETYEVVYANHSMLRFFESVTDETFEKANILHKRYRTVGWVKASSGESDLELIKRFSTSLNNFTNELSPLYRKTSTSFQMSHLMCLMMLHFGLEHFMAAWDCIKARSEVNTKSIVSDICLVAEYAKNGGNPSEPFEWIKEMA